MSQSTPDTVKKTLLSNGVYDILKHGAQFGFPAVIALYYALSQVWGFPNAEQVMGTLAAINVFIGGLVGTSAKAYKSSGAKYDGVLDIKEENAKITATLNLDGPAEDLLTQSEATFKVNTIPFTMDIRTTPNS